MPWRTVRDFMRWQDETSIMTESALKYEGINPPNPTPAANSQLSARTQRSTTDRAPSSPQPRATLHVQSSPPSSVSGERSRPTSGTGDFPVEESSAAFSLLVRSPHPTRSWVSMTGILPANSGVVSIITRPIVDNLPTTDVRRSRDTNTRHGARKPRRSTKHWSSYEVPEDGTGFRSSPP